MRFIAGLLTAIAFTAIFRVPIKRAPVAFYLVVALLQVLFISFSYVRLPLWLYMYFIALFQSNTLAMGFFTIVMFIGVFDESSVLRRSLAPIRAELSIIASILCVGHIVRYGAYYLGQLLSAQALIPDFRFWAAVLATLPVILLIPLAITSVKLIRARMNNRSWVLVQRLAYPFFGLVFVHILFYLLSPALSGNTSAIISVSAYLVVGISYAALRVRHHLRTRKAEPVVPAALEAEAVS